MKVIKFIANQFQSQDRTVRVDKPSPLRYSVSTTANGKRLLLDTMILLPHANRSIDSTVAAICEEAARALGSGCVMGGLVHGQIMDTFVEIGGDEPTQARLLLAQALEAAPNRKVWMLTYDTTEKTFAIGIQPAVRPGKPADGRGWVTPLPRLSTMP